MDIVERLRKNCTCSEVGSTPCRFEEECENAFDGADEIERLRQYKSELEDAIASNNQTEIFNKSARLEGFVLIALREKE